MSVLNHEFSTIDMKLLDEREYISTYKIYGGVCKTEIGKGIHMCCIHTVCRFHVFNIVFYNNKNKCIEKSKKFSLPYIKYNGYATSIL